MRTLILFYTCVTVTCVHSNIRLVATQQQWTNRANHLIEILIINSTLGLSSASTQSWPFGKRPLVIRVMTKTDPAYSGVAKERFPSVYRAKNLESQRLEQYLRIVNFSSSKGVSNYFHLIGSPGFVRSFDWNSFRESVNNYHPFTSVARLRHLQSPQCWFALYGPRDASEYEYCKWHICWGIHSHIVINLANIL